MSDEERERPSRSMIKSTWGQRESALSIMLVLAEKLGNGKLDQTQALDACKGSFYAGVHFVLSLSGKLADALEKSEISEEAAADTMSGLVREMNDYALSKEAELITKITLARAEYNSKGQKNDSTSSQPPASPSSEAGPPGGEGNADGPVGNG